MHIIEMIIFKQGMGGQGTDIPVDTLDRRFEVIAARAGGKCQLINNRPAIGRCLGNHHPDFCPPFTRYGLARLNRLGPDAVIAAGTRIKRVVGSPLP